MSDALFAHLMIGIGLIIASAAVAVLYALHRDHRDAPQSKRPSDEREG